MVKRSESAPLDFKGFSAFADHTSAASAALQMSRRRSASSLTETSTAPSVVSSPSTQTTNTTPPLRPSPVYLGSDAELTMIFRRIGQKKDATTKIRSMAELASIVFPVTWTENGSTPETPQRNLKKSDQIVALSHLYFLFQTKLIHDINPTVRSEAVQLMGNAVIHAPKAFVTLLLYQGSQTTTQLHGETREKTKEYFTGFGVGNALGYLYAARAASESSAVGKVVMETFSRIIPVLRDKFQEEDTKLDRLTGDHPEEAKVIQTIREYIVGHIEAILQSSSRPVTLYEALMGKATNDRNSSNVTDKATVVKARKNPIVDKNTESDQEDVEELYERTVISCLKALSLLLQEYPETRTLGGDDSQHFYYTIWSQPSVIWKHMNSSWASLRRETYQVLSNSCQFGSSLVHPWAFAIDSTRFSFGDTENISSVHQKIQALITQSIASEREMSNIPTLFEMLLVFIHSLKQLTLSPWSQDDRRRMVMNEIKVDALVKSLVKPLRQACYGSSASGWAPILLPIVASVPNHFTAQVLVVKNLWEGRSCTPVHADKIAIVSAVAEICGYLLVSTSPKAREDFNTVKEVTQLLVETVSFYLSNSSGSTASLDSSYHLCKILSKVLSRLDAIPSSDDQSIFSCVQTYFWNDGIPPVLDALSFDLITINRLNLLIIDLSNMVDTKGRKRCDDLSHFPSMLKHIFNCVLKIPLVDVSDETISLLHSMLIFTGANILSEEEEPSPSFSTVEGFLMNRVLLFSIPRVSSMDRISSNQSTIENIFSILFHTLLIVRENAKRNKLWEVFLNELIKVGVRLEPLSVGLSIMERLAESTGLDNFTVDVIPCQVLNSFVLQLGKCITADASDESPHSQHQFLAFHGIYNDHESQKNLYDFLRICLGVTFQQSSFTFISSETVKELTTLVTEIQDDSLHGDKSNLLLRVLLERLTFITDRFDILSLISAAWRRGGIAWETFTQDLLNANYDKVMSSFVNNCFSSLINALSKPIGMNDARSCSFLWSERALRLYNVCKQVKPDVLPSFAVRCGIGCRSVWSSALHDDLNEAKILYICLTQMLDMFETPHDRCEFLVGDENDMVELMAVVLSTLCLPMSLTWSRSHVKRCEDLLSLLDCSSTRFYENVVMTLIDSLNIELRTENIVGRAATCMLSVIDFLLDRFIGRMVYDASSSSILRLKDGQCVSDQKQSEFIQNVESKLYENIVRTYLSPPFESKIPMQLEIAAETCNVLISRCGISGKAGLGSRKYDLFLALTALSDQIKNALTSSCFNMFECLLLKDLSLAMGYGCITSPSEHNFLFIGVDCRAVLESILVYLKENSLTNDLCSSFIMFVSKVSPMIENDDDIWLILQTVSSYLYHFIEGERSMGLLLLKAIESIRSSSTGNQYPNITRPTEVNTYANTLAICSRCIDNDGLDGKTAQQMILSQDPKNMIIDLLIVAFENFLCHSLSWSEEALIAITKRCVEDIYHILYTRFRWKIFGLLMSLARKGTVLCIEINPTLPSSLSARLDVLLSTIADRDEAEELQQDFSVSANWLSRSLMLDLESWDDALDELSDEVITSRFLAWLLYLETLDSASRSDIRNRSHLSSYIESTNAINSIMSLVLMCANFQDRDKSEWMAYITLDLKETLPISQLASLILFRTFESAPTLMKVWWNDECPKALQSSIAKFVETKVSPETLRRELDRMKKEANLSDLVITGSLVSREVTASYIQDECNLSVLIRIPSQFPLRNVEVDCNKTYGVSEKRWRHWSLQIMRMLNSQDGSILDALLLWKQNVDKEFEGVEPCPVCYSVLSVKTHSMPNLECKTCHNRFHNHCLYKWFQSSGKNLCVLCQQPWSGSKLS